jgi:hypothetical protein
VVGLVDLGGVEVEVEAEGVAVVVVEGEDAVVVVDVRFCIFRCGWRKCFIIFGLPFEKLLFSTNNILFMASTIAVSVDTGCKICRWHCVAVNFVR